MSEATPPLTDPVSAGRDALARHDWQEGYELLTQADLASGLPGPDLEALAMAAFFAARPDDELVIRERAFKAYEAEGNAIRAAFIAVLIARAYGYAGKPAIASAWVRRAERIIGADGDTYVHGYLALVRSETAIAGGDIETALEQARRAIEIGDHSTDADLRAFALTNLGALKIASGEPTDGVALMEEASIAAVNGELTPFTTGLTACRMIGACRDLTDYRRATEWIEATERYCDRQSLSGFPGICRIHRAEVAAVGGAWERAEAELERATTELEAYRATPPQADGFYAMGDIRRLMGDLEGAETALREAHQRGRSPQPALALIRLAEGKVKDAMSAINTAVDDETWDRWTRAKLLPAQVEITIAAGDLARARAAADELDTIVTGYPSPALDAARRVAFGRVLIAEGDPVGAARELRVAIKSWREVGAPYEVARTRALLSNALRSLDDDDDADLELKAAIDEFGRLGARIDLAAAERALRDAEDRRSGPVTMRRTFMFTDIVGSTTLAETLGDKTWERVLRWHDDTIRRLVREGGGELVNTTGDGFFVAFEMPRAAIDTAVAIQRAVIEYRASSSFGLAVRIGLHTTDANRRGDDYSGKGVHVAARVASLAEGGEILATTEALEDTGDVITSHRRSVAVRGVTNAVTVATIAWS